MMSTIVSVLGARFRGCAALVPLAEAIVLPLLSSQFAMTSSKRVALVIGTLMPRDVERAMVAEVGELGPGVAVFCLL